jgi:hypothetical protein
MTRPQAVVFDIGNVLIEWNPERYYDSQLGEAERRRLFAEVDLHGMNEQIDAGGLFRETVYDLADRTPAWPFCAPCAATACRCSRCRISASTALPMRKPSMTS